MSFYDVKRLCSKKDSSTIVMLSCLNRDINHVMSIIGYDIWLRLLLCLHLIYLWRELFVIVFFLCEQISETIRSEREVNDNGCQQIVSWRTINFHFESTFHWNRRWKFLFEHICGDENKALSRNHCLRTLMTSQLFVGFWTKLKERENDSMIGN